MKVNLKVKLISSYLLSGLVPMLCVGIYVYFKSSNALREQAEEKLTAVSNIKKKAIDRYFSDASSQLLIFAHELTVVNAAKSLTESYNSFLEDNSITKADLIFYKSSLQKYYEQEFAKKFKDENNKTVDIANILSLITDTQIALQYNYISANPNPLGSKNLLDVSTDKSKYTILHKNLHPGFREYADRYKLYDIFIVDATSANIVYTVFKELDFSTNLLSGPYSNTNLADAFRKAKELKNDGSVVLTEYKQYLPSYDAPATFMATPIWSGGEKVAIAIFQMPIDQVNLIMAERSGMGVSGETYLIGKDLLPRSDSFLDKEKHSVVNSFRNPDVSQIKTEVSEKVFSGPGVMIGHNYLNNEVISAYMPVSILGLDWGIVAEMSASEAFSSTASLKWALIVLALISSGVILLMAIMVATGISKKISEIAKKLSSGAAEMADSSASISQSSTELSEAATEQAASLQETVSSIDEISSMVQRNADAANASAEVSNRSSEAAARGKKTVESMITSIGQISESNENIISNMKKSNDEISKIVQVIAEIGDKTKVINDIVFQTKLLSFNASVEAARAGEHGKGFAVVAEEVGNLASMSGKAALEITEMLDNSIKQVTEIVEGTKLSVDGLVKVGKEKIEVGTKTAKECGLALDEILKNVSSVNDMVKEIATASSEQATGVKEVTKAMQQLDQTTHQNTSVAQQSSTTSKKLKNQADMLNDIIGELLGVVDGGRSHYQKSNSNIISIKKTARDKKKSAIPNEKVSPPAPTNPGSIKVAGFDSEVPLHIDDRFEDL